MFEGGIMKKSLIFILLLLLTSVFISAENFTLTVYCDYLSVADPTYKEEYGGKKFFPEAKITFRVMGNFYLWGSGGFLPASYNWEEWSNKGIVNSDIDAKNASQKLFYAGGLGYYVGYRDPAEFSASLEVGFCATSNKIKITSTQTTTNSVVSSTETTESGIGLRGNLGITYGLMKNIFAEASVGYMYVWDKRDEEDFNAGGLRLAIGLGLKF